MLTSNWSSRRRPRKSLAERFGWAWRHYGVRRLALIAAGGPLYYATRWPLVWRPAPVGAEEALPLLDAASHDVWFGLWAATVATPVWWIAQHFFPSIDVRWGFRVVAFVWLFDGVAALVMGVVALTQLPSGVVLAVLTTAAWPALLPAAVAAMPWGCLSAWERLSSLPVVVRWRYSGRKPYAAWISSHLLKQHTQSLGRTKEWLEPE